MKEWPSNREPIDCTRLRRSPLLQAYLDGELPVPDMLDVQLHLDRCPTCAWVSEEERAFRRRLRRGLPRVMPPTGLRERVRRELLRATRKGRAARYVQQFAWGAAGSAVALLVLLWASGIGGSEPDLAADLVSHHRLFSQLETPAELVSHSRAEVAGWLRRQLSFSAPVPDFSQAGLWLVGARLATNRDHPMAHVLYEKGRTLLSLYVLPGSEVSLPRRGRMVLEGREVVIREAAGHQVVLGRSGRFVFAVVSTLDREAVLECARTFLRESGQREAGVGVQPREMSSRWPVFAS